MPPKVHYNKRKGRGTVIKKNNPADNNSKSIVRTVDKSEKSQKHVRPSPPTTTCSQSPSLPPTPLSQPQSQVFLISNHAEDAADISPTPPLTSRPTCPPNRNLIPPSCESPPLYNSIPQIQQLGKLPSPPTTVPSKPKVDNSFHIVELKEDGIIYCQCGDHSALVTSTLNTQLRGLNAFCKTFIQDWDASTRACDEEYYGDTKDEVGSHSHPSESKSIRHLKHKSTEVFNGETNSKGYKERLKCLREQLQEKGEFIAIKFEAVNYHYKVTLDAIFFLGFDHEDVHDRFCNVSRELCNFKKTFHPWEYKINEFRRKAMVRLEELKERSFAVDETVKKDQKEQDDIFSDAEIWQLFRDMVEVERSSGQKKNASELFAGVELQMFEEAISTSYQMANATLDSLATEVREIGCEYGIRRTPTRKPMSTIDMEKEMKNNEGKWGMSSPCECCACCKACYFIKDCRGCHLCQGIRAICGCCECCEEKWIEGTNIPKKGVKGHSTATKN